MSTDERPNRCVDCGNEFVICDHVAERMVSPQVAYWMGEVDALRADLAAATSAGERADAAHADCSNLSNAEAHRIFQEAKEQRERAERAEQERDGYAVLVGELKDALFDLAEFCECPGDSEDPDTMCKHHAKAYALAVPSTDRAREIGAAVENLAKAITEREMAYEGKYPDGTRHKPYAWEGARENADTALYEAIDAFIDVYRQARIPAAVEGE